MRNSATVGLESVDTFCYDDMLSAGGGVEECSSLSGEMCWGQVQ